MCSIDCTPSYAINDRCDTDLIGATRNPYKCQICREKWEIGHGHKCGNVSDSYQLIPQRDYLSRGVTAYNNAVLYVHKKKIALTVFLLEEKQICIYVFNPRIPSADSFRVVYTYNQYLSTNRRKYVLKMTSVST